MNANTIAAIATVLALGSSATTAVARNWVASEPDAAPAISAGASTLKDSSIDYGSRVQVRIYRPDGIYEIRDGHYHRSPSSFDDADTETSGD